MLKASTGLLIGSIFMTLAGCSTTSTTNEVNGHSVERLIISEPLAVNVKAELALARLSEFLNRQNIEPEKRARLFYERGILFDSLGLPNLAVLDFKRAIRLRPDMADAYNFMGIHFTQVGDFDSAYEAFDATLELAPDHEYVFLNRGISLYYGGRHKLAVDDLKSFHAFKPEDPYRVVWLYLAEQKVDSVEALANLQSVSIKLSEDDWASQIASLYLGKLSEGEFIAGLTDNIISDKQLAERLCEAYYYLGKYSQIHDRPRRALNYFKLSLATNVHEYVEHRYARREINETRQLLREQLKEPQIQ